MLRPDPEFAQSRVEGIGDLVALDKDPVGIEHGCFLPRVDQGGAIDHLDAIGVIPYCGVSPAYCRFFEI